MTDALIVEQIGAILRVTLNRPEKLNALNVEIFDGLNQAVDRFADDETMRVFLIRSTGRYFCAGADIMGGTTTPDYESSASVRNWYRRHMGPGMWRLYDAMEKIEKPFVVAHHAPCVGGGLEMSLSCDIRLAAKSARYSFPEAKLGCIPASGGVSRLTRLVGPHWAKWVIMANQAIDAERALHIGLVHAVYPDDEFEERVMEFCQKLATEPREMMAVAKTTIDLIADASPEHARTIELLGESVLEMGEEHHQMMSAMRAKLGRK